MKQKAEYLVHRPSSPRAQLTTQLLLLEILLRAKAHAVRAHMPHWAHGIHMAKSHLLPAGRKCLSRDHASLPGPHAQLAGCWGREEWQQARELSLSLFFPPYCQVEVVFTHQVQHAWCLISSSGCPGVAGGGRPFFLPFTQQHPAPMFAIFPIFNVAQGCVATAEESVGSQPREIAMILMASFKIAEKPAQTEINYPVRFHGP